MSKQTRFNKVWGKFGGRGTGKTEDFIGNPKFNLPGIMNIYLQAGFKVIIIDTMDHPSYQHVPFIDPKKFHLFKSGAGRIVLNADDVPKINKYLNEHQNTWNSLLLYEDAKKHTTYNVDKNLIRLIGDSKQKNIDIGFMYHCWAHAPKDLYRYFDYIDLHKTKDTPLIRKLELGPDFDEAMQTYTEVKKHASPFYHKLIDTGTD